MPDAFGSEDAQLIREAQQDAYVELVREAFPAAQVSLIGQQVGALPHCFGVLVMVDEHMLQLTIDPTQTTLKSFPAELRRIRSMMKDED